MKNSSGYCVVLLSPPSRWSGLKSITDFYDKEVKERNVSTLAVEWIEIDIRSITNAGISVSTLAVEWIEIGNRFRLPRQHPQSPPSRWSGLKSTGTQEPAIQEGSPPSRWSGLKSAV